LPGAVIASAATAVGLAVAGLLPVEALRPAGSTTLLGNVRAAGAVLCEAGFVMLGKRLDHTVDDAAQPSPERCTKGACCVSWLPEILTHRENGWIALDAKLSYPPAAN